MRRAVNLWLALPVPECQASRSSVDAGSRVGAPAPMLDLMEHQGLRAGHIASLAGAGVALASLWQPWYGIEVPQAFRDALSGAGAQDPGLLGAMARGVAAALPQKIEASGWLALHGADVVLCVAMLTIAALVVGAAGAFGSAVRVDPGGCARAIAALAGLGLVLSLEHVINKPGGGAADGLVHVGRGLWMAVGGCAVALVGGLAAGGGGADLSRHVPAAFETPYAPPAVDPTASVAPPAP